MVSNDLCCYRVLNRFVGCIGNVQIGSAPGSMVDAKLNDSNIPSTGCSGICRSSSCRNKGRCLDRAVTFECECRGTGYNGKLCETGNVHFIVLILGKECCCGWELDIHEPATIVFTFYKFCFCCCLFYKRTDQLGQPEVVWYAPSYLLLQSQ